MSDFDIAIKNLREYAYGHSEETGRHNYESLQRTLAAYAVQQSLRTVLSEKELLRRPEIGKDPLRLKDDVGWGLLAKAGLARGREYLSLTRSRIEEGGSYEQDTLLVTESAELGTTIAAISRIIEDGRVVEGNYSSLPLAYHARQENLLRGVALFGSAEFNQTDGRELSEDEVVAGLLCVSARAIRTLVNVVE
jgi:hypothetical protein